MNRFASLLLALASCGALACDGARREPPVSSPAGLTLGGRKIDVTLFLEAGARHHAVLYGEYTRQQRIAKQCLTEGVESKGETNPLLV